MHPKLLPAALLVLVPIFASCSHSASAEQPVQKSKDELPGDDSIVLFPDPGTSKEPAAAADSHASPGGSKNATGDGRSSSERDNPPVPEPGTLFIVGSGLAGFAALRRRRRRKGRGA
ncbi:MAG: PEP-CTERM sorting domain-containing protein, partial [Planctomycetota bacterium]